MQTVKGFINYSDFGNSVSFNGHQEIYDEIEIYIPDECKIKRNIYNEPLIVFDGKNYLLREIAEYKDGKILVIDMSKNQYYKTRYLELEYRKI